MEGRKESENVDEQLDRLNEVLAQTLASARQIKIRSLAI